MLIAFAREIASALSSDEIGDTWLYLSLQLLQRFVSEGRDAANPLCPSRTHHGMKENQPEVQNQIMVPGRLDNC